MLWGNYSFGAVRTAGTFTQMGGLLGIDRGGHFYASKDIWDPVKSRRINWGWAKSVGASVDASVGPSAGVGTASGFPPGSAQTLAREVLWDPALQMLVFPPLEEQAQLRRREQLMVAELGRQLHRC